MINEDFTIRIAEKRRVAAARDAKIKKIVDEIADVIVRIMFFFVMLTWWVLLS